MPQRCFKHDYLNIDQSFGFMQDESVEEVFSILLRTSKLSLATATPLGGSGSAAICPASTYSPESLNENGLQGLLKTLRDRGPDGE